VTFSVFCVLAECLFAGFLAIVSFHQLYDLSRFGQFISLLRVICSILIQLRQLAADSALFCCARAQYTHFGAAVIAFFTPFLA